MVSHAENNRGARLLEETTWLQGLGGTTEVFTEVPMLVLSRKLNEKIVINGNITITVVKIDRNQVRLGIEAPGEIPVYREEILPLSLKEARDAEALAVCS
jgi:carbon storage regulator